MLKFSIKDLLVAMALVAIVLTSSVYVLNFKSVQAISSAHVGALMAIYFGGWMIIGGGLGLVFKRRVVGIVIGLLVGVFVLVTWRFHPYSVLYWSTVNWNMR